MGWMWDAERVGGRTWRIYGEGRAKRLCRAWGLRVAR